MAVNPVVVDGEIGIDGIAHCRDRKLEGVPFPTRGHITAAGKLIVKFVNVVAEAPLRLLFAKLVRDVDVDGLTHKYDVAHRWKLFKPLDESIIPHMPLLPLLLMLGPSPAAAQDSPAPAAQVAPAQQAPAFDPAADYISAGQDEPGYRSWYLALPARAVEVKAFNAYLGSAGVAGVVPTWELLRTATSWSECGGQPFEVPPTSDWPHLIQTLRYVRDYVVPAVGPVEPVSVYRNPVLNQCAGGAPESAHKLDSAIDMVPLKPITREELIKTLCVDHTRYGAAYGAGLGFYAFLRFHVDSTKYRRWNMDPQVQALCPPILHPSDVASVGQPLPAQPQTAETKAQAPVSPPPKVSQVKQH